MKGLCFFLWVVLLLVAGKGFAQTTVLNGTSGNATNSSNFSTGTSGSTITLSQGFFAEYLVVGGGGGGGGGGYSGAGGGGGGGGGAGAVATGSSAITTGTYHVVVGAGGSGGGGGQFGGGWVGATGANGASSSAFGVTSVGGEAGWGAGINTVSPTFTWTDGTGGWGGWSGSNSGGGKSYTTSGGAGGGGAGSSGLGGGASGWTGGVGGAGTTLSLTGSSQTYGVGGAGANGSSSFIVGASGAANTGNGGAGGGGVVITSAAAKSGGAGGSGLVVVRYAGTQAGTGGTVTAGSGSAAGNTLHTFSSTGSSTLDFSGLNLDTRLKTTLTGAIAGAGNLSYTGPGTLVTKAVNTYSGTTTVSGGTLIVDTGASIANSSATTVGSGAHLKVNGSAGVVSVNGTLSGSGTVGAVTLNSGGTLAVGNSPGLLTAASASWNGGSTFQFEILNATGMAGTAWDLFSVTGALDMTTISASNKMILTILSADLQNFQTSADYSWVFAQAASLTGAESWSSGLDVTDRFAIDSSGFNGGTQPGRGFKVVTGTDGGLATLSIQAVPEPSSASLLILGLAAVLARGRRCWGQVEGGKSKKVL